MNFERNSVIQNLLKKVDVAAHTMCDVTGKLYDRGFLFKSAGVNWGKLPRSGFVQQTHGGSGLKAALHPNARFD
jgi:hypothetical protein